MTGSVEGVSGVMFSLLATQSFFWVLYGFQKKDWVMIIPNTFVVLFALIIVAQYILLH